MSVDNGTIVTLSGIIIIVAGAFAVFQFGRFYQRYMALLKEDSSRPSYNDIATFEDAMAVIIDTQMKLKQYYERLESARRILGNGRNGEHDRNQSAGHRPSGWDELEQRR